MPGKAQAQPPFSFPILRSQNGNRFENISQTMSQFPAFERMFSGEHFVKIPARAFPEARV
jgi:hypothetical protein